MLAFCRSWWRATYIFHFIPIFSYSLRQSLSFFVIAQRPNVHVCLALELILTPRLCSFSLGLIRTNCGAVIVFPRDRRRVFQLFSIIWRCPKAIYFKCFHLMYQGALVWPISIHDVFLTAGSDTGLVLRHQLDLCLLSNLYDVTIPCNQPVMSCYVLLLVFQFFLS